MSEWDGSVVTEEPRLTNGQIIKLIAMAEALQKPATLNTVVAIKQALIDEDHGYADQLWDDLSEEEQEALWVAPSFGGIFTTDERTLIRYGENKK